MAGGDAMNFKPQVKHVISKELMLYFDKIRQALLDEDEEEDAVRLREAALASVRDEPGLHQLVPYFVQFIAEKVTHNLKSVFVLRQMMELTNAMIANKTLFIDPSVNYISASILTCIIGKRLGNGSPEEFEACYKLREFSASLLGLVATKYGRSSAHLKPRLARMCLKSFLDPSMPLGVHYGAIKALLAFAGPESMRMLIIPNLKAYETVLVKAGGEERDEVKLVVGAIMQGISLLSDDAITKMRMEGEDVEALGEQVREFVGDIVGGRIARLGNERLDRAVLECML
jgi:transcription initiation factor TFIID subunit 6